MRSSDPFRVALVIATSAFLAACSFRLSAEKLEATGQWQRPVTFVEKGS